MGKLYIIFLATVFTMSNSWAQNAKQSFVEVSFGLGKHGSGDLPGYVYGFSYGAAFSNRFYWQLGLEGTTNDKLDFPLKFTDEDGNEFDSTLHNVISGFQFIAGVKYNLLQSSNHQFGISLLPFFRYQASSFSGEIITLFPVVTELPFPVRLIRRLDPSRTTSFGGSLRVNYQYHFGTNLFLGVLGGLQTDTNGDTLYHGSLKFGKAF